MASLKSTCAPTARRQTRPRRTDLHSYFRAHFSNALGADTQVRPYSVRQDEAIMKLISISLGSWLVGLAVILVAFVVVEGAGMRAADLKGATITSLIVAALLFSLAYAPSLFWLRKRLGGCRPAALFPVAS